MGDKVSPEDKSAIETEVNKVKEALKGTDVVAIKKATEDLTQAFYGIPKDVSAESSGRAKS